MIKCKFYFSFTQEKQWEVLDKLGPAYNEQKDAQETAHCNKTS